MYTLARQGVEEYGERSHKGFTLTRSHLGDLTLVQYDTTKELHIVVHHVPLQVVTAGNPVVLVDGLVALDGDKLLLGRQVAVEVVGRYDHRLVLGKTACRILHDGEGLGQNLVQHLLDLLVDRLRQLVDLLRELLLLLQGRFGLLELYFERCFALLVCGDKGGNLCFQRLAACAQLVVRELLDRGVYGLDLLDVRLNLFAVFVGF